MARECTSCHRTFQDKMSHCPYDGAPLVRSAEPDQDPYLEQVLDEKYRIETKLGEGGMCNIYRATVLTNSGPCAIKILRKDLASDESSVWRFKHEVRAASIIKHPNVVELLDAAETSDGTNYMVMELLDGVTLKQELLTHGPFGLERLHLVVKQICAALDAAHAKGIIHRDLKPDNIMILKRGDQEIVKVFDFGIAKLSHDKSITGELLPTHIVMGTPRYMSPEQCHGHPIDTRSDIYSLGVIVYEMLTGVPPFTDSSARVLLNKHTQEPVPSLKRRRPSLPSSVERAVMHALEKSPLKRPQTAREFSEELDQAIHSDNSISPEQMQPPNTPSSGVSQSNLVPVVKQVSGTISIVEYMVQSDKPERSKKMSPFSSGQIKTQIKSDLKKNWVYWLLGLIALLILAILITLYFIFTGTSPNAP